MKKLLSGSSKASIETKQNSRIEKKNSIYTLVPHSGVDYYHCEAIILLT